MASQLIVAAALFGASAVALTQASGQAVVVNNCDYAVSLNNVPAAGEGAEPYSTTLAQGGSYSQYYTGLDGTHDGWSIKLAPESNANGIIQFEYTYQPTVDSNIWFDMSFVNGDPFKSDWVFSSNDDSCQSALTHAAYMFPTDDAFGMQHPCDASSSVTLTLCPSSGSSSSGSGAAAAVSSIASAVVAPITSAFAAHTSAAAAPSAPAVQAVNVAAAEVSTTSSAPAAQATSSSPDVVSDANVDAENVNVGNKAAAASSSAPTTLITSVAAAVQTYAHTVTEVETAWVTSFTTVDFPAPTDVQKRHAHHGAHHHA